MSSREERRLGDRIARTLYRDPDYLDDPVLSDYVQSVWQPLLAAARLRGDLTPELDEGFAWKLLLGRDRSVNAFALPGGYLGVHLGLLSVVGSRDELASVLGHELSHVTQRHISRLMSKSSQQAPWVVGAMILGALAASKSNIDAGNALIVGGQALSAQSQLNFSRDMEREADRVGLGVMTQAGFNPQGFVGMFDKLQQASRLNDNGAYPYLRSHPLTTERVADMQARLPLGGAATESAPDWLHAMMTARARVLANAGPDALRAWAGAFDARAPLMQQVSALYASAMAASRLRDAALARTRLQQLQVLLAAQAPMPQQMEQQLTILEVEIALLARDLPRLAMLQLAQQMGLERKAGQGTLARAELLLQAQLVTQVNLESPLNAAAQNLLTWVSLNPADALAWQWLASIHAAQGQTLRALRAEAEAQVAVLDYEAALDRLMAAQDRLQQSAGQSSADHIDASIIDTRRRQIEQLLKDQSNAKN
jgi:predicted Zn-dependent protease